MSEPALPALAWQRWTVQRITAAPPPGGPRQPCAEGLGGAPAPRPAESPEHARGLARGRREGHALGLSEGLARGQVQGHQAGLEEGLARGRAQALEELQQQAQGQAQAALQAQAQGLLALAQSLPPALAAAQDALAQDLMDLALMLAQQVLGQALAAEPALMLPAVRGLLQAEPALTGQPQLLLHPADLALVREHLADELQATGWHLRAEAGLARGGCRVLAASGELDASLPTRWQRVSAALHCQPVLAQAQAGGA